MWCSADEHHWLTAAGRLVEGEAVAALGGEAAEDERIVHVRGGSLGVWAARHEQVGSRGVLSYRQLNGGEDRAMKKFGVLLLTTMLLFTTGAPAAAHHGHGHVFAGPLLWPLLLPFAVAATITAGVAAVVTAPFTYPAPYAPAPAYAPPVYAAPPPPPAPSYWYYCPSARGYYPYVNACPDGWLTVVPR